MGVAIDGEVVHRDNSWAANAAQRERSRWTEVRIGPLPPNAGRPLDVPSDEASARKRPVPNAERWSRHGHAGREIDSQTAVGPVDAHRTEDLFCVDADPGPRPLEPGPINGDVQTGQRRYA